MSEVTPEQRERHNAFAREQYAYRTLAQQEKDKARYRERYHRKYPNARYYAVTDELKKIKRERDKKRNQDLWKWVES